ncbi:beta-N-acetylhexosaminidase [Bermanella marisrubri]|uniref:beta-N-acetylhexosaminidase n=1 Tax=Bermanella marisrubri TaxID=207949 RepID=Q1N543_9GAMM|nr:beta-N-acetylhexosaminidase [Bermanella marisrubri]EAT13235.1 Glycoside hydrolase, family 3-like protein [Oceanobacter sp. RED65] [Bermanella marisrubri]QIZ84003.1 beta-N-acetylhexosaminidase [Bermanella marisrubri]
MKACLITDIETHSLSEDERTWLSHSYLAGIILFTRHFESKTQLKTLISEIKAINPKLLITVDHEGGRVQRFRDGFTRVPAMGRLGKLYQEDSARANQLAFDSAVVLCCELLDIGIDLTYAPVLDIDYQRNQVVGDRGFAHTKEAIVDLASHFIDGVKSIGFPSVAKHFPGHGWVTQDSHVSCPVDERSFEEIKSNDLWVFDHLMPKIDWIMPAHVVYERVDEQPAGFSKHWVTNILRNDMGFQGPVVSDDLSMEGAAQTGGYASRAKAALDAGCNVMLACNSSVAPKEILEFLSHSEYERLDLSEYQSKPQKMILDMPVYQQALARIMEFNHEL